MCGRHILFFDGGDRARGVQVIVMLMGSIA